MKVVGTDLKARSRREIGLKLKALREGRQLSQVELAMRLELSQAGLSLIERGKASLNTEDFLQVLRIFNVPASHFFSDRDKGSPDAALQNALARLGARQLYENDSLPSENLEQANQVIREVLIDGRNPRHLTALAPVIATQISHIHLSKLWADCFHFGIERRLGWLLEHTLEALKLVPKPVDRTTARNYRQAETTLQQFLRNIHAATPTPYDPSIQDVLGVSAPSQKTLAALKQQASVLFAKWRILSPFQIQDFVEALKASQNEG